MAILPFAAASLPTLGAAPTPLQQMPKPINMDSLHTNPDVTNHMSAMWRAIGNGMTGIEWGFRVDKTADPSGMSVVPHPNDHRMHSATFPGTANTVAEFHTHTHGHDPKPSDVDRAIADRHKINVYTFGEGGLYKYDWQTKKTTQLQDGLSWAKAKK